MNHSKLLGFYWSSSGRISISARCRKSVYREVCERLKCACCRLVHRVPKSVAGPARNWLLRECMRDATRTTPTTMSNKPRSSIRVSGVISRANVRRDDAIPRVDASLASRLSMKLFACNRLILNLSRRFTDCGDSGARSAPRAGSSPPSSTGAAAVKLAVPRSAGRDARGVCSSSLSRMLVVSRFAGRGSSRSSRAPSGPAVSAQAIGDMTRMNSMNVAQKLNSSLPNH